MWFSRLDKDIQWKMPVQRATGYLRLHGKYVQTPITPDRKRCQKRLIKKGRMNMNYLQSVEEELLTSKKSTGMTLCGTQELNDLVRLVRY